MVPLVLRISGQVLIKPGLTDVAQSLKLRMINEALHEMTKLLRRVEPILHKQPLGPDLQDELALDTVAACPWYTLLALQPEKSTRRVRQTHKHVKF
ncbi:MAG: hypothetical protein MJE77_42830 [Proteobacteria bacterium]|nr:hypothetical protein [Pseudomonadota bacterium]